MGYYHTIIEHNFRIPETGFAPICKHLLDSGFTDPTEAVASGKTFSGGKTDQVFYAWTCPERLIACVKDNDLPGVFTEFGFDVKRDALGGIEGLLYDNKRGDEDQLFAAIAPFMEDFQFVSYRGEDGAFYRYYFVDQEMKICEGEIVFHMK